MRRMWNESSTSPIFDIQTCNAPQIFFKAYYTDYNFETKNVNIYEKKMILTIFVKKSFFFRAKKCFDGNFLVEITKKIEK
jgi:hypothetical protein